MKIEKVKELMVKYFGMEHPKVVALFKFIEDYSGIWEEEVIRDIVNIMFYASFDEECDD